VYAGVCLSCLCVGLLVSLVSFGVVLVLWVCLFLVVCQRRCIGEWRIVNGDLKQWLFVLGCWVVDTSYL